MADGTGTGRGAGAVAAARAGWCQAGRYQPSTGFSVRIRWTVPWAPVMTMLSVATMSP